MQFSLDISRENSKVLNKTKTNNLFPLLLKFLSLACCLLVLHTAVWSQQDSVLQKPVDSVKANYDSAVNGLFNSIRKLGADQQRTNINEYNEGTIARKQDKLIEELKALTLDANSYLENGIDTTGLSSELNKIERWYDITSDGVFINTGSIQTRQNLETSYKILTQLLTRTLARKSSLDNYYQNLDGFKHKIDSLYKDSILYKFSSDSAVLMLYVKKLTVVSGEIKPIDSALKKTSI
jgi:hypothetical protein